ncbi:MAG TPA: hypothetical protein VM865_01720 [Acidobacteriaceae bacterium]|nr:hypothetical protein [Acidobacteriaceae bacterium]
MSRLRTLGRWFTSAVLALPLSAQTHHVGKPERVTRAVGVYEWTGDLAKPAASRLVPVSLFIDAHFEDAGVFLARPVPLALETGNVYALLKSGEPIGTVDLDFARKVTARERVADSTLGAWYGYGRYMPLAAETKPVLKPSANPSAIVATSDSDDRPHFVKRSTDDTSSTAPKPGSTTSPTADPDRPSMSRRSGSSDAPASSIPASNAPSSPGTADVPDTDPERPTLKRHDAKDEKEAEKRRRKESGSGVTAMGSSLNEDPDRPSIRRGKVESPQAAPALTGLPADIHQAVVVSDPANREPHLFTRDWESSTERAETLAALQKLADPLARQYLATNHLQPGSPAATGLSVAHSAGSSSAIPSTPADSSDPGPPRMKRGKPTDLQTSSPPNTSPEVSSPKATAPGRVSARRSAHRAPSSVAARTAAKAAPTLIFTTEQLSGFTLSYGGLPTFVYTAAVPTVGGPLVRITVLAQRLPSGELQTSLTSITDDAHLDRTPWMRLVDAVDPNASHRASLLFELRAHTGRQFALYSLLSAHAEQTFVTRVIQ